MSLQAAANLLARHGREGDSVLVHMSPEEVRGLQQLAEVHGTTLTINPHTGMPEAFSLKSLLPVIAGMALNYFLPGVGTAIGSSLGTSAAVGTGIAVGGGTALATGSLEKGIMAGLGAYGGAGIGEGLQGLGSASLAAGNQSAAETARLLAQAGEVAPAAAQEFATANAPGAFTAQEAVKEGLSQAARSPSSLYGQMGPNALKYTAAAAAPVAQEMSRTQMPDVPKYSPTAAIHPKYAYRDQEGNVQFVDLPGVKMEDWKPEQSVSDYVRSLVAEPTYEDEIKRAAGGGVMTADELAYQNDPVIRMAGGGVSDAAVKDWFASNAGATDAQIAQAMDQFTVSPEQVSRVTGVGLPQVQQRYEAAIAPQIVSRYTEGVAGPGGTTSQYGSGYLGIYDDLTQRDITAQELFNAPGYKGWSQPAISHAYDVAAAINKFDPRTDAVTPSDKEWVNFMDTNKFSVKDIAQATGLSEAEVQRRYDAAKVKSTVVPPPGGVGGGGVGTTDTYTGGYTTTPQTYAPEGTTNPYGNAINPGDITRNPDGTLTVTPNVPGRPYGGFTGMGQVRDAYTAGGGRLGQVLAPTKTYQNTGLSAAAYDYLMGKGPSPVYTQKPPVAVNSFKDISNPTKAELLTYKGKSKVWQDGKMIDNPYVSGEKEGEKKTDTVATTSTYDGGGGGDASGAGPGDGGDDGDGGDGGGAGVGDGSTIAHGGYIDHNKVKRVAPGGLLAAYAAGGMSGDYYNLGGYSDGGRLLRGPGDGVSDSIPATIGGKRPARLADGEFVVPARIVSEIGNGSTEAGARKLYAMMERVQQARKETVGKGRSKVAKNTRADKYLPV